MALMVFGVTVLAVLAVAFLLARLRPAARLAGSGPGRSVAAAVDRAGRRAGGPLSAMALWLAGSVAIFLLMWPLGRAVYRLEDPVDWPLFDWFAERQIGWWTSLNDVVTLMGNTTQTRIVTVVGAVGLCLVRLWRRQRAWVPLVVLPAAYVTEHYLQVWLADLVDRGHPPTTLGTWPSGGVARAILIYGLVAYFLLVAFAADRLVRQLTWTAVALVGVVEAYTRLYLLKHWFTDVLPGGLLFGALLLLLVVAAVHLLDRYPVLPRRSRPRRAAPVSLGSGDPAAR